MRTAAGGRRAGEYYVAMAPQLVEGEWQNPQFYAP
jgi:hypothetical protein